MNTHNTLESISKDAKQVLNKFYSQFSIETTPNLDKKIDSYKALLPKSTAVTIAAPSKTDRNEIIRTARRLRQEEMEPVPHIVARSIPDIAYLESLMDELQDQAEVDHVLVIAGDIPSPAGPFHSSMDVLESDVFEKRGIKIIGVSGHPEGTPYVDDKELSNAIRWKNEYASRVTSDVYICTQFSFEAAPVISWEEKIRDEGNQLSIKVGVPGIATLQTLMRQAIASGIGQSINFLTHQVPHLKDIMSFSTPQHLILDLATHCAQDSSCLIKGIHFFPFGGLEKTSKWISTQLDN